MTLQVTDQAHLEALPDGTIITWLRIPGDETSRAVAFVRAEVEYDDGSNGPTPHGGAVRTVWISPGGYSPQTPESAGVTYPAQVVWVGEFRPDDYPANYEYPQLTAPELLCETLTSGGTWAREKALDAAARFMQGCGDVNGPDEVIDAADRFTAWLDRPFEADPEVDNAVIDAAGDDWGEEGPPPNAVMVDLRAKLEYQRLHALANEIDWAAKKHGRCTTVSTAALRHYANGLD